jgi:2-oxo-4-hydroxy-4-carboxy-5-ureidoimidazoline decarboxylase
VYLVNATGKSADEMLAILNHRLGNDPVTERAVVRDELSKINRIRLTKLLEGT